MNGWMLAGGAMALICTGGHAIAGSAMFYQPIKSVVVNELHAGVLAGMWHFITIHFSLSTIALFVLGTLGQQSIAAWLI